MWFPVPATSFLEEGEYSAVYPHITGEFPLRQGPVGSGSQELLGLFVI